MALGRKKWRISHPVIDSDLLPWGLACVPRDAARGCASVLRFDSNMLSRRNPNRSARRFVSNRELHWSTSSDGNRNLRGPGGIRGVEEDEIQLSGRKLVAVKSVQQVQVDEHQFAVTRRAQSLEHQVQPQDFSAAVNFLSDHSCLAAQLERAQVFIGDKRQQRLLRQSTMASVKVAEIVAPLLVHEGKQPVD